MAHNVKRRIGNGVFDMPEDLWLKCKEHGVSSEDILFEKKRFMMLGVNTKYSVAAAVALRRKESVRW